MRVTLIYVGLTSEKFYTEACAEYEKRIGAFADFKSICIKEEKIENETSRAQIEKALSLEEQRIKAAIPKNSLIVTLCIEGKSLSSEGVAKLIEDNASKGVSSIVFVIGSSHGISTALKASSAYKLSMSAMTFPHMLARVMLTEQIYRAFTIINGKNYHK
ncbi:MAG: 23S rRNA (pseudouridine(1915)-N(3))-methyltransferase RlmH [Ruminococcaceae bacterium]|nr:23S rRNA (pseudouridine(1915)-N(3))-methyltransferase RlmH [Oscillospiraceae bacterium]